MLRLIEFCLGKANNHQLGVQSTEAAAAARRRYSYEERLSCALSRPARFARAPLGNATNGASVPLIHWAFYINNVIQHLSIAPHESIVIPSTTIASG